ncbi:NAD(P)/FAD-dependent oxidoreductase [Bryobacter aggregatus]|uniref:NAD(P)/FAD-dependent oxidoreductase n=1 Tax=Bryobacter aggregatus TaxID=360054 RepID=UPI0004E0BFA0|nr:NAD(P)/FAD-dependent oxidoreductase [Bryobacter aggregatus]
MESKHRVLIVGGGFGGLHTGKALNRSDIAVTLVDRRNYHLFQPLLYQVATGGLSPGEIAAPLRAIFEKQKSLRVVMAHVTGFDLERKIALSEMGDLPYDTLVLAAGARTSYFGNDAWSTISPGLKNIEDATKLRARLLNAFEEAEKEADPEKRKAFLTFLIVGGGPTGVELAGALSEIANDTLRNDFRSFDPEDAQIIILDAGPRILSTFSEKLSASAEQQLIELNVHCRNSVKVLDVTAEGATVMANGKQEFIPSKTVVWAAGVTGSPLAGALAQAASIELVRGGKIEVEADCSVPGYPDVFVIGDLAHFQHGGLAHPLPGVAQVAMQMGNYVGDLIGKRLDGKTKPPPFVYWDKGNMAVIGRRRAVAQIGKFEISGYFAWLIWVFIHILYLVNFQSRVIVAIRWGFDYFSFNRGARLITRSDPPPTEF